MSGEGLRIDLCGRGLLVDGLLAQLVASLILLLHAVDEEEDEEHGEHQPHRAARNQSWNRVKTQINITLYFGFKRHMNS